MQAHKREKILILAVFCLFVSTIFFVWLYVDNRRSDSIDVSQSQDSIDTMLSREDAIKLIRENSKLESYKAIGTVYARKGGIIFYVNRTENDSEPVYTPLTGDINSGEFGIYHNTPKSWGLAYDDDDVFLDGKEVTIDKETLEIMGGGGYLKDRYYVYRIKKHESSYFLQTLERDVATFRLFIDGLGKGSYTFDKNGVYFEDVWIPDSDPYTFSTVASPFEINNLKPKDIISLSNFYMRDARHVIHRGSVLPYADPRTFFPIFTGPYYEEYGADANHVFYNHFLIEGADPETFTPLSFQAYEGCVPGKYALDGHAVYYKEKRVEGADPKTFEALYGQYGKDKNHIYLEGVLQENLDPETFMFECNYG